MPKLWPLFGLSLRTERLDLTPVSDGDIDELTSVAQSGVHDPDAQPFANLWTDRQGSDFEQRFAQYFWAQRARWSVATWALPFAVRFRGRLIGVQQIQADEFPVLRTVNTSSWLGSAFQGIGLGTEMRAAVLSFGFDALGAEAAISGAYAYNVSSIRVSQKLGYMRNGVRRDDIRGEAVEAVLFRLAREAWLDDPPLVAEVRGLEPCLELFGLP
ncbi:MAG: GCN5-like N-acetyltransferase [Actinomycetia bacterium]|nr:GCN5-like N-acetyltransferase [Actinomycetes bacterium]